MLASSCRRFKFPKLRISLLKLTTFAGVIQPSSCLPGRIGIPVKYAKIQILWLLILSGEIKSFVFDSGVFCHLPASTKLCLHFMADNLLLCKSVKNLRPFRVLERCFDNEDGILTETKVSGRDKMRAMQADRI